MKIKSRAGDIVFIFCNTLFMLFIVVIMLYPFLQKYFVKGVHVGSVKG